MQSYLSSELYDFLMEGDPAIAWQTRQLYFPSDKSKIHELRTRIEFEGWGSQIIKYQQENGLWYDSLMLDKYRSTIWVLNALRRLGIYPLDRFYLPCETIVKSQLDYTGGIKSEGTEEVHVCLTGITLGLVSYFKYLDERTESLFHFLVEKQMANGSWYCEYHINLKEAVFSTTLTVLEGLREYKIIFPRYQGKIEIMQKQAHDFLLNYRMYKMDQNTSFYYPEFLNFSFPYIRYDVLTALDYLRSEEIRYDRKMDEALDNIDSKRIEDKWRMEKTRNGLDLVQIEPVNSLSRYNTLRAIRVLDHFRRSKYRFKDESR